MNLKNEISNLNYELMREISSNATSGDMDKVIYNSKIAEELKEISKSFNYLEIGFIKLKEQFTNPNSYLNQGQTKGKINVESAKAKGEKRRQNFIKVVKEKNITLNHIHGVKYNTSKHNLIGVASASERNPNHWFLGLPEDKYDTIVLICEDDKGGVISFIPPKDFIQEYFHHFSRDKKGQIKFNISKKHRNYFMLIPGTKGFDANNMIDNYENL